MSWSAICEPVFQVIQDYDFKNVKERKHPHAIDDAPPQLVTRARAQYARIHHMPIEQAEKIDVAIVLGEFYVQQYQVAADSIAKLCALPYPQMLASLRTALKARTLR